jgi:hypothetical protein
VPKPGEKIVRIYPHRDVVGGLRNLAEQIEAGDFSDGSCTIVLNCAHIFHFGTDCDDSRALEEAIFDLNYGIQRLLQPTLQGVLDNESN